MNINKTEPSEDQREISLNETSLKRPYDVVDVIGGHGPWQFRQWIVFFAASICNSMILFSALFLPSQTVCVLPNSTVLQPEQASLLKANNTSTLLKVRNYVGNNHSFELLNNCNSTTCNANVSYLESDISSSNVNQSECWNSQIESWSKCIYVIACVFSGLLVYFLGGRFGRRPVALVSCVFLIASSVATSWADVAAVFVILRFIVALGIVNIYFISTFSLMKYVQKDYKVLYFLTGHLGWGLAHFLLPAVAWFAEDWLSFNLTLSFICFLLSIFVWWSPETPSSFRKGGQQMARIRKTLKYAAFTNGYSTTDVDLLSHSLRWGRENKHDMSTPTSSKKKIYFILYSCLLFSFSFITAFLYFAAKWHAEWYKVDNGRVSFSFLGTTEAASTIILLFLTCFIAVKYLWSFVSVMTSVLMIVIYMRSAGTSSTSSAFLYTGVIFFTAAAWTLVLVKCFCHRICGIAAKFNLVVMAAAVFAGALIASAVVLKMDNQNILLALGIPNLLFAAATVILPDEYYGAIE